MSEIFSSVQQAAEALRPELTAVSKAIFDHPELGKEEVFASGQHCALLEKYGFAVEKGFMGIETAFKAVKKTGKPGPTIAFLAEYDALPGIGHGCGHNILGATSVGAGIVSAKILENIGGTVEVYGTPAEETDGSKAALADGGAFDKVDAALMTHPSDCYYRSGPSLGIVPLRFEFFGRTAHAAACPEEGINALHACISLFNNISALREHFQPDARVHGVIKKGGEAANVVPDYTMAEFYVRADKKSYLEKLVNQVKACAEAAALSNGATVKITNFEACYDNMITNETLSDLFTENLLQAGVPEVGEARPSKGSSDAGNVSQKCPMIQPYFSISDHGKVPGHTRDFAACTLTGYANDQMILNVRAFAMTAYQLATKPELLQQVKDEFKAAMENK
ncbi:MAG: M20 family metallopeptidase [Oscillospiraceae bacterium]|jgi:amidohydrolase|nr:M20 family metallopeptidase [Oscillospiraceae bacterium]